MQADLGTIYILGIAIEIHFMTLLINYSFKHNPLYTYVSRKQSKRNIPCFGQCKSCTVTELKV